MPPYYCTSALAPWCEISYFGAVPELNRTQISIYRAGYKVSLRLLLFLPLFIRVYPEISESVLHGRCLKSCTIRQ